MFRLTGQATYYDILERMLYNAVIAGISLKGTEFFYPNPLEADGVYGFNQGACTRQPWFDCSCCPTNLIRFIPAIPGLIYATQKDTLYLKLFIANHATINMGNETVEIEQETNYPRTGKVTVHVKTKKPIPFTLKIRVPAWVQNEIPGNLYTFTNRTRESYRLAVNGQITTQITADNGYLPITRQWTGHEQITLQMPMHVQTVAAKDSVKDDHGKVALSYGPLVYCLEEIDNPTTFDSRRTISLTSGYSVEWNPKLLGGVNVIREKNDHNEYVLIPYYAWANRGIGKMKVWK
jgi:DUF1680 family protein